MLTEDRQQAIDILSASRNCKVLFNYQKEGSSNITSEIVIIECDAITIHKLASLGYSLYLRENVIHVNKF